MRLWIHVRDGGAHFVALCFVNFFKFCHSAEYRVARVQALGHCPKTWIWPISGELKSRLGTHGEIKFKGT